MRKQLQALLVDYGPIALIIYLSIFVLVFAGFSAAIRFGMDVDSVAGSAGTFTAAYIATKVTQPVRIAATLLLTPVAGKLFRRLRPQPEVIDS